MAPNRQLNNRDPRLLSNGAERGAPFHVDANDLARLWTRNSGRVISRALDAAPEMWWWEEEEDEEEQWWRRRQQPDRQETLYFIVHPNSN